MKLRIDQDGTVRCLWFDGLDWLDLGVVSVRRASHVEFSDREQMWYVRAGNPKKWFRRVLQSLFRRPFGEILYWAKTRQEALDWERVYYEPGGPGWVTAHGDD